MGNACELLPIMLNRKTNRKRKSYSVGQIHITNILMSNENATPFRCAELWPFKSCERMCYVYLLPTTKATILLKNFNSSDCANIRRDVSLQIALIAFLAFTKNHKNFVQMVFVSQWTNWHFATNLNVVTQD